MIRKLNGQWFQLSQDGKHKVAGPFDTQAQAIAANQAVLRTNKQTVTVAPGNAEYLAIRAFSEGTHRTEKFQGRDYLVVPVVALVEGVIQGINAEQPELALAAEFGKFPASWNGRPIVMDHPVMDFTDAAGVTTKVNVSANRPEMLEQYSIGFIFNTKLEGTRLLQEAYIDVVRAEALNDDSRALLAKVKANEVIEVSTGLFTEVEKSNGKFNTVEYGAIWRGVVPDHLAFLSEGLVGACSIEGGCGGNRANAAPAKPGEVDPSAVVYAKLAANCSCEHDKPHANAEMTPHDYAEQILANSVPQGMMDQDIRKLLDKALAEEYTEGYVYVIGFTTTKVIFSKYEENYERCEYQQSYSISADNKVSLRDDLEKVVLTTTITPAPTVAEAATLTETNMTPAEARTFLQGYGHTEASLKAMADADVLKIHKTVTDALKAHTDPIAAAAAKKAMEDDEEDKKNKRGKYAEQTTAPAANSSVAPASPKVLSADEFLLTVPESLRESMSAGMKMLEARKTQLITALVATKRCKFNETQLKAMSIDMLESMASLADIPADYSGLNNGAPAQQTQEQIQANSGFAPTPPKLFVEKTAAA